MDDVLVDIWDTDRTDQACGDLLGFDFSEMTSTQLESVLVEAEAGIARLRLLQTAALRVAAQRQIPTGDGCKSLTEWAASRLDITTDTARTLTRLARIDVVASDGDSTDRIVATSRLAASGATKTELDESRGRDVAGVGRMRRHREHVTPTDEQEAHESRYVSIQPSLDEGVWRMHGLLIGTDGKIVSDTLTRRADEFGRHPDGHRDSRAQRTADALTAICTDHQNNSNGGEGAGGSGAPQLTIHVDATEAAPTNGETGVWVEAGPRVGAAAIEEILCNGVTEVIAHTEDGTPLKYGRKTRVVSPELRRAILHRNGHVCTADGCDSTYRLEPHHILPGSQGGRTDPDNLTTLCWFHHHVVIHGRGMRIDPDSPPQRRRFLTPDNRSRPPP